jgi:hypothetical protein
MTNHILTSTLFLLFSNWVLQERERLIGIFIVT